MRPVPFSCNLTRVHDGRKRYGWRTSGYHVDCAALLPYNALKMNGKDCRLPKSRRIQRRKDFESVFRNGAAASSRIMTVYVRRPAGEDARAEESRLGVSAPRRIGGAVQRNRAKRLVREAFRLNRPSLPQSCDLIVVPKGDWSDMTLGTVVSDLIELARRAAEKMPKKDAAR